MWGGRYLAFLLLLSSCSVQRTLPVIDTLGSAIDLPGVPDVRQFAPIVIVATVLENRVAVSGVPAARLPKVLLDLHLVRCRLENSLRGQIDGVEVSFYYFADTEFPHFYQRQFDASPGRRYIFFLNNENGVLRSIGDAGPYSLEVLTGAHPGYRAGENLGLAIADILFTLGADYDSTTLAKDLSYAYLDARLGVADLWGSRLHNIQLIRGLLGEPEPIRSRACLVLAARYEGQYDCLYALMRDPNESSEVREKARTNLLQIEASEKALVERLRDPAILEFPGIGAPDSRKQILEELQSELGSPNSNVRRGACIALHRYYPHAEIACSAGR